MGDCIMTDERNAEAVSARIRALALAQERAADLLDAAPAADALKGFRTAFEAAGLDASAFPILSLDALAAQFDVVYALEDEGTYLLQESRYVGDPLSVESAIKRTFDSMGFTDSNASFPFCHIAHALRFLAFVLNACEDARAAGDARGAMRFAGVAMNFLVDHLGYLHQMALECDLFEAPAYAEIARATEMLAKVDREAFIGFMRPLR